MNLKLSNKVLVLLLLALLTVQAVAAQSVLDDAFSIFDNFDGPAFYNNHSFIIDLIAYLFFFIFVGRFALKNKLGDQGTKLGVIVGAILATSMAVFEAQVGFNLGHLGPLAALIVIIVFGWVLYSGATGLGADKISAFSFGFLISYALMSLLSNSIISALEQSSTNNSYARFTLGAFKFLLGLAVLGAIYSVVKFIINLFKGGGFFGSEGEKKALQSAGRKAGQAAKAAKNAIPRLRDEGAKEAAERKEAAREQADLGRIRQLSQYGMKDAEGMKDAIGLIIKLVKGAKGRLTQQTYQEIIAELQVINQKGAEIQNTTKALEGVIADLEKAEYDEYILAAKAATDARIVVEDAKRAAAGGSLKRAEMDKLTRIQVAIENDAKNRAAQAWTLTKKELESLKNSLKVMEVEFGKLLTDAIPRINPTQYETAVQLLEKAQSILDHIKEAFKIEGGKLPDKVRKQISAELKDLKNEKGLEARINRDFAKP